MISHKTTIRVRYADTDMMQFVYNGKYLEYFEVGRTELLRHYGLAYSELEKQGYQLPLIEANLKYKSPATYDDELIVEASVSKIKTPKLMINYTIIKKENDEIIVEGYTEHVFINSESKKPVRPPKIYLDALAKYFE